MLSELFAVVSSLSLLASAASTTTVTPTAIFTVAVPLGLGPENAIFNAGIVGSQGDTTTITYSIAEDVLEAVTATINPTSILEVQEGETRTCTFTQSEPSSILCTFGSTFTATVPLSTVPIPGPTI